MPALASYSETQIADYMLDVLGDTADALGWTPSSRPVIKAVEETLLAYGAATAADATDIRKLRAVARWQVWAAVVQNVTSRTNWSADGQSISAEQFQANALRSLVLAEADAAALGIPTVSAVRVDRMQYVHDPYAYVEDEHRTLP